MRLTLVNPSSGFNKECVPLGLASIAGYLKKYGSPDLKIKLLDANCQDIYKDFDYPDVIAVTAVTQDVKHAIAFAKYVHSHGRKIPIILGGVHITTYKELPYPFTIGVIGEGEETMLELMSSDFVHIDHIKGICYKDGINGTVFTEPRPLIQPLDLVPMPDRSIANMDYYCKPRHIIPYYTGVTMTMMTSRGCPFNCTFCSTRVHWQKFRAFSAERVIQEMQHLIKDYNAEIIHIFDDLFITDKKRLEKIYQLVVENGINQKVKFMCLARSDLLDDKTMRMLKEMNVVVIGIGMESGCQRTLDYLKQHTTTIEKNRRAIDLAAKYDIPVMGSFMVGNPGETEEELMQTLAFIQEYRDSPYLSPLPYIATAFPGTAFWDYAKQKNIPVDNFDNIVMDIPNDISGLDNAPLLTGIPKERFFEITQLFAKEATYCVAKQCLWMPHGISDYVKAYALGIRAEKHHPLFGFMETTRILFRFLEYKYELWNMFVPVGIPVRYNRILGGSSRELYEPITQQMFRLSPSMMGRKIPEANVQQSFVMNTVHMLARDMIKPKILCVGSFEDTACDCLKRIGYIIEENDPAINYDLETFMELPTTVHGSYDIIFSTSVIEHVQDDELFINQISRLLKPGGVGILTCDFNDDYKPGDCIPATDVRFYTKKDMARLMQVAKGCELVDEPCWDGVPDFVYDGCIYTFAALVFRKETTSLNNILP